MAPENMRLVQELGVFERGTMIVSSVRAMRVRHKNTSLRRILERERRGDGARRWMGGRRRGSSDLAVDSSLEHAEAHLALVARLGGEVLTEDGLGWQGRR